MQSCVQHLRVAHRFFFESSQGILVMIRDAKTYTPLPADLFMGLGIASIGGGIHFLGFQIDVFLFIRINSVKMIAGMPVHKRVS